MRYAAFSSDEAENNLVQQSWLDEVNSYVQEVQGDDVPASERFDGEWVLTVHWDHVHPSPHGDNDTTGFSSEELNKVMLFSQLMYRNYLSQLVSTVQQLPSCDRHQCASDVCYFLLHMWRDPVE